MNAALPTIAALSPPEFDVTIVDEHIDMSSVRLTWM
jgi:hypothetical protein